MDRRVCVLMLALSVLVAWPACSKQPSPKQLCTKLEKLEAKSKKAKKQSSAILKKKHERCVKDMTKLKKKKPKAYRCAVKCAKQDNYDTAMICTIGCILKSTTKKERAASKKQANKEMDALCKTDWSGRSLHEVSDTVDGVGFTVKIPTGLDKETKKGDGTFPGYVSWSAKREMCGPGFTVQVNVSMPRSLDSIRAWVPKQKILHKRVVPGGYLVVTGEKGDQYLEVAIYRKSKSGKTLKLSMGQRSDKLPKVLAKQRAWLEKVAVTFQAK